MYQKFPISTAVVNPDEALCIFDVTEFIIDIWHRPEYSDRCCIDRSVVNYDSEHFGWLFRYDVGCADPFGVFRVLYKSKGEQIIDVFFHEFSLFGAVFSLSSANGDMVWLKM